MKEFLRNLKLSNPYHLKLEKSGYGVFPDSYTVTEEGIKKMIIYEMS